MPRLLTLTLAACAAPALLCAATPAVPRFDFLEHPGVTREEVERRLGAPSARFDRDGVVAYRLRRTARGYELLRPSRKDHGFPVAKVDAELMVQFSPDGLALRHQVVTIRGPL